MRVFPAGVPASVAAIGILLALFRSDAAAAASPADKCESGKNSTAGKYALCLHKAQSKFVGGGSVNSAAYDEALLRCDAKYSSKWQGLEDSAAGLCPSNGDAGLIQDFLDECIFAAEEAVGGGTLPDCSTDLTTCTSDLGTCNGDLGTCGTDLGSCNGNLGTCSSDLGACSGSLGTCNSDLGTCNGSLGSCSGNLGTCSSDLSTCNSELATCTGDLSTAGAGTATAGQVLAGRTFTSGAGLGATGTMTNVGQQNVTPGTASVTITQGYHDGTGTIAAIPCGNGTIESPERCDGANLSGLSCTALGFARGTLACSSACTLNVSGCQTDLPFRRVFVTSTGARGNLGGLTGGDAVCQAHANAALLGGSWKAWLSDAATNAKDRITDDQYRLVDRTTVVAASKADLTDGVLSHEINRNEFAGNTSTDVWTGSSAAGTTIAGQNCSNWSSASNVFAGWIGGSQFAGTLWSDLGVHNCTMSRRLYCFEGCDLDTTSDDDNCGHCGVACGSGTQCVNSVCAQTKLVFTTSDAWQGSSVGGLSGGDAKCQSLAATAGLPGTYKAWLAVNGTPVSSRLSTSFTGAYRKPSGELVAVGWAGLTSGTLLSPIDETETSGVPDAIAFSGAPYVWTGASASGAPTGFDCGLWNGFGGAGSTGDYGFSNLTSSGWSDASTPVTCSVWMGLYCVQQ